MQIIYRVNSKFRKTLRARARAGHYIVRLLGSAKNWFIGIERGQKIYIVSPRFANKFRASLWNFAKHATDKFIGKPIRLESALRLAA